MTRPRYDATVYLILVLFFVVIMKFKFKLNDHATEVSVFDTTETVVPLADAAAACSASKYSKQKLYFVGQKHHRPMATTMTTIMTKNCINDGMALIHLHV